MAQILNLPTHRVGGPFYIDEGSDGVDETFEISCYETGRVYIRTRYWEARDAAFEMARLFTIALNAYRHGWKADKAFNRTLICDFLKLYPGPYRYAHVANGFCPSHLILDQNSNEIIHEEFGVHGDEAYRNTHLLIVALNHLFRNDHFKAPTRISLSSSLDSGNIDL